MRVVGQVLVMVLLRLLLATGGLALLLVGRRDGVGRRISRGVLSLLGRSLGLMLVDDARGPRAVRLNMRRSLTLMLVGMMLHVRKPH